MLRTGTIGVLAFAMAVLSGSGVTDAGGHSFTVNLDSDAGDAGLDGFCDISLIVVGDQCTLRAAIQEANDIDGLDTINFAIAAGVQTLAPTSAYDEITDPVVIDGTTQPGFAGQPMIEIDGTNAGASTSGLKISAGSSTVKGLVINNFGVISGAGIHLLGAGGNVITGNYLGTDVTGTLALGNTTRGVHIGSSPDNIIGGDSPAERNVISGNGDRGVMIGGAGAIGNHVIGNYIGTDVSGMHPLPNESAGVHIQDAPANFVGGTAPGEGNVVSGNGGTGVEVIGNGSNGNVIQGNYIGTNADGDTALANFTVGAGAGAHPAGGGEPLPRADGIAIRDTSVGNGPNDTLVGGSSAAARNVISGNQGNGVRIAGPGVEGTIVQGNHIGTGVDPETIVFNGVNGVLIEDSSVANQVGGLDAGEGNVIGFNAANGVQVAGVATLKNGIHGNSIHSNDGFGIDNFDGGNGELAPPVITGFAPGSVSGTACANCTVDVFSDSGSEGRIYEGSTTADALGAWSFPSLPQGPNATATATDGSNNTSEFSELAIVPDTGTPTPTPEATVTPTGEATETPTGTPIELIQGDTDCNNFVNTSDGLHVLRWMELLGYNGGFGCPDIGSGEAPPFGDVDCEDGVTAADMLMIVKFVAGFPEEVPGCTPIGEPLPS